MMIEEFESGDKIYYTPDYGSTGHLARVVEVYEDSNEMLIELELRYWNIDSSDDDDNNANGYGFETKTITVPSKHVHSRNILDDW